MRTQTFSKLQAAAAGDNWTPPLSIQWMPAGESEISATVNGQAKRVKVKCVEADAARLDSQLQAMLTAAKDGTASEPWLGIGHNADAARAGVPVAFVWQDGIRLQVTWTDAGLAALQSGSYTYFSPEFDLAEDGSIAGLPIGSIGALVNTPAFQSIERLAAAYAEVESARAEVASLKREKAETEVRAALGARRIKPDALAVLVQAQLTNPTAAADLIGLLKASVPSGTNPPVPPPRGPRSNDDSFSEYKSRLSARLNN
jgi:phage I-like protein